MKKRNLILPAYFLLLMVMFILPYFSASGYSIISNTTSQLGAQLTPNAWIMNATFCLLGITCIIESVNRLQKYCFQKTLLIIFGVALIFTAFFRHAPLNNNIFYSVYEDEVHSIFSSIVGFSFTFLSFSAIFIEDMKKRKFIALLMGMTSFALSILIFNVNDYAGIWQRLILITSIAWIMYFLREKI